MSTDFWIGTVVGMAIFALIVVVGYLIGKDGDDQGPWTGGLDS